MNELIDGAERPTTKSAYSRIVAEYSSFAMQDAPGANPFPVSEERICRYATVLAQRNLKMSSLRQYLSAIANNNKKLGHGDFSSFLRLQALVKGVGQRQVSQDGGALAPKPVFLSSWALVLAQWLQDQEVNDNSRMIASVLAGYLFASRAATIAEIRVGDMPTEDGRLFLRERARKSKQLQSMRQLFIPIDRCAPAGALSRFLIKLRASGVSAQEQLVGWENPSAPAVCVKKALQQALLVLRAGQVVPSQEESLVFKASHCLRRGAAVAMMAIGVHQERRLSWGGWSTDEAGRTYVRERAFAEGSAADGQCFGWMLPSHPSLEYAPGRWQASASSAHEAQNPSSLQ
jgi:hypothetical protein